MRRLLSHLGGGLPRSEIRVNEWAELSVLFGYGCIVLIFTADIQPTSSNIVTIPDLLLYIPK